MIRPPEPNEITSSAHTLLSFIDKEGPNALEVILGSHGGVTFRVIRTDADTREESVSIVKIDPDDFGFLIAQGRAHLERFIKGGVE